MFALEKIFVRAHLASGALLLIAALFLEKRGFQHVFPAVSAGFLYSLLTIACYAELIHLGQGKKNAAVRFVFLLSLKLTLLGILFLNLSSYSPVWLWSALLGFLSFLPAGFWTAWRSSQLERRTSG